MANRVLALNERGEMTYCTCPPELRGKGRCNHVAHQEVNESVEDFVKRAESITVRLNGKNYEETRAFEEAEPIGQNEIDAMAAKLDQIAGRKVTVDNLDEVIRSLGPHEVAELAKVGFDASPKFSLPISSERYDDENTKNKLYFCNLHEHGVGGKASAISQMFDKVGPVPTAGGVEEIKHSYLEGLTPHEYFTKQFDARVSSVSKSVGTSEPGYAIWEGSVVYVKDPEIMEQNMWAGSSCMNVPTVSIKWSELKEGMEFVDGSVVEWLDDWTWKPCYLIKVMGETEVVLSEDHLLQASIIVSNREIRDLEHSSRIRACVDEESHEWVTVKDMWEFYSEGAKILLSGEDCLERFEQWHGGEPQKVRCISTSTGHYMTNGMMHHNTARKLFYAVSDVQVIKDCGGPYIDALHCKAPMGHICEKCAHAVQGGERIKEGTMIGSDISTNLSEGLTQLSMSKKHSGSMASAAQSDHAKIIMGTFDGYGTSPIIQKVNEQKTTEGMRQVLYEGLKEHYLESRIKMDDINIQMIARKLTSYKRTPHGLEPVMPGEKADICSIATAGNVNNMFKTAELRSGYNIMTKPSKQKIGKDAANDILM